MTRTVCDSRWCRGAASQRGPTARAQVRAWFGVATAPVGMGLSRVVSCLAANKPGLTGTAEALREVHLLRQGRTQMQHSTAGHMLPDPVCSPVGTGRHHRQPARLSTPHARPPRLLRNPPFSPRQPRTSTAPHPALHSHAGTGAGPASALHAAALRVHQGWVASRTSNQPSLAVTCHPAWRARPRPPAAARSPHSQCCASPHVRSLHCRRIHLHRFLGRCRVATLCAACGARAPRCPGVSGVVGRGRSWACRGD